MAHWLYYLVIVGIPPEICTHKIQLVPECMLSINHQHCLNLPMQEVVKNKTIKWLNICMVYPITDSRWESSVLCVPKKDGITMVPNGKNELVPMIPFTR